MDGPRITVTPGGPYLVSGSVPLRRRRPVQTERGEPIAWEAPDPVPADESYALCRCGRSGHKPFCDGSHESADWDGTETASTSDYAERATTYAATGATVRDDRSLCQHAGFCSTTVTNVWKMTRSADDTAVRSQMMAMVERCPSGALTCSVPGAAADLEPDLPVAVNAVPDGPLQVTGGVPVERADGQRLETRNRVVLCRCGASKNKPLCDGSHASTGFAAE